MEVHRDNDSAIKTNNVKGKVNVVFCLTALYVLHYSVLYCFVSHLSGCIWFASAIGDWIPLATRTMVVFIDVKK